MDTGENTISKEYYEALTRPVVAKDKKPQLVKFMGIKLIFALMNAADGDTKKIFHDISKPKTIQRASNGLMVYNNVLWMRMFEAQTGGKMPNGAKWFDYVPFWKPDMPKGKRLYVFRKNPTPVDANAVEQHTWRYGTF